jgi:hypothetical protein
LAADDRSLSANEATITAVTSYTTTIIGFLDHTTTTVVIGIVTAYQYHQLYTAVATTAADCYPSEFIITVS